MTTVLPNEPPTEPHFDWCGCDHCHPEKAYAAVKLLATLEEKCAVPELPELPEDKYFKDWMAMGYFIAESYANKNRRPRGK